MKKKQTLTAQKKELVSLFEKVTPEQRGAVIQLLNAYIHSDPVQSQPIMQQRKLH